MKQQGKGRCPRAQMGLKIIFYTEIAALIVRAAWLAVRNLAPLQFMNGEMPLINVIGAALVAAGICFLSEGCPQRKYALPAQIALVPVYMLHAGLLLFASLRMRYVLALNVAEFALNVAAIHGIAGSGTYLCTQNQTKYKPNSGVWKKYAIGGGSILLFQLLVMVTDLDQVSKGGVLNIIKLLLILAAMIVGVLMIVAFLIKYLEFLKGVENALKKE